MRESLAEEVRRVLGGKMKKAREFMVLGFFSALLVFVSCGPQYDPNSEGTMDAPVELSTEVHRGRVGVGGGKYSGSYYTFVSTVANPTIYYNNRTPDDDLDCGIYTDPDFYHGFVALSQEIIETDYTVFGRDYTGVRLYVRIGNYEDENVVAYDIYYD
jgi:hypothetical protein